MNRTPTHHTMLEALSFHFNNGLIKPDKDRAFVSNLYRLRAIGKLDRLSPGQAIWLLNIYKRCCGPCGPRLHPYEDDDIKDGKAGDIDVMIYRKRDERALEATRRKQQKEKFKAFAPAEKLIRSRRKPTNG